MRKKTTFYLSVIFLLLSTMAHGQGSYNTTSWKFSNPKQFGFTVFDVNYFDNSNVIAVGSNGGIAKSTDGGQHWTYGIFTFPDPSGLTTSSTFFDVHYVTANVAYAVGAGGSMAKTIDAGATWTLIKSPLYNRSRNINAVWFLNKDTGYIGGQHNTPDSLPKLYFTKNGGATWDSLNAPLGGKTRVGYINNPNLAPLLWDVDAKDKEIQRIEFKDANTGYIIGGGSGIFPKLPSAVAATCLPSGTTTTTGSNNASLVWKFSNGSLIDYSLSKERLGYSGINVATTTCTTLYGSITPQSQTFKAMNIISDSCIVIMSFNNNIVVKINTGVNDKTLNMASGLYENGKWQLLNFPFPPTAGPQAGPAIPPTQVLLASNPYQMKRAANGKLFAPGNFGYLWTSVDTGRTWKQENSYVQNTNFSGFGSWAIDIAPNGHTLVLGSAGAVSDSMAGSPMTSNYVTTAPQGSYSKIDFVNCNNAIAAGSGYITRTIDGGKTWIDNNRPDFISSFYSINGLSYPTTAKAYFAVSNGNIYRSDNPAASQAAFTIDPVYSDGNFQMNDIAAIGNDTVYAIGYSTSSVPVALRKSTLFRSYNNAVTWQAIDIAATTTTPAFTAPTLSQLSFPSRTVGYAAGSRNGIYKTTDGGTTWTSINPFPTLNQFPTGFPNTAITYTEIQAVDNNTVFAVGNMFTNVSVRRVYKSTDGGSNWTDITGNIPTIWPVGNLSGVLFSDANFGYVISGNTVLKTTDGGASWALDISPATIIFQSLGFAPRTVPSSIPAQNRKVFAVGTGVQYTGLILEYGKDNEVNVNSSENITGTCSNVAQGIVSITAAGGLPPYTYSIDGGASQTSNVFSNLTQGPHTITVRDAFCGTMTKQVTVGVSQVAVASAGPDQIMVEGGSVTLYGSADPGVTSILWSPAASLDNSTALQPVAKPATTTVYTLTVTNANGCTTTDQALVTVLPKCIKVMRAFTPNGDGMNDKWLVTDGGACTAQIKVKVFNRYGSEVYTNESYQNDWTGTYKGSNLPDGTYYYVIEYKLIDGRTINVKGDVTILR